MFFMEKKMQTLISDPSWLYAIETFRLNFVVSHRKNCIAVVSLFHSFDLHRNALWKMLKMLSGFQNIPGAGQQQ